MTAPNVTIHPSAIVDEGAQIGEGSRVWHFAHVCSGAKIGQGVSLGQNVFVGNKVVIGDRCKVQNNVSVYDNVTLEEGVFCGPSMVFTNVYNPRAAVVRDQGARPAPALRALGHRPLDGLGPHHLPPDGLHPVVAHGHADDAGSLQRGAGDVAGRAQDAHEPGHQRGHERDERGPAVGRLDLEEVLCAVHDAGHRADLPALEVGDGRLDPPAQRGLEPSERVVGHVEPDRKSVV